MNYIPYLLGGFILAVAVTPLVRWLAFRVKAIDVPRPPRNLHTKTTAKLGGLAIYVTVAVVTALYLASGNLDFNIIPYHFFMALFTGGAVLMLGGYLDDRYELPAYVSIIFPALASFIVVWSGIGVGITFITNPFGGVVSLQFMVLSIPASAIFSWLWMMGMMYTTKILDGMDGLVAGIGIIASFALFALSLTEQVNQPMTATLAIILVGTLLGYLIYAFHPASIFLGEGGSTFIGFMLGLLSIILGGKIATALLVMGIPIFDLAWVIIRRVLAGQSFFHGDRRHLHFKILDLGFSQRTTVMIMYGISALFGFSAVFLQSRGKLIALGILAVVMVVLGGSVMSAYQRQSAKLPEQLKD